MTTWKLFKLAFKQAHVQLVWLLVVGIIVSNYTGHRNVCIALIIALATISHMQHLKIKRQIREAEERRDLMEAGRVLSR